MSDDFYVYTLAYPEEMGATVFYVGKGANGRIADHAREAKRGVQSPKCDVIRQIWDAGYDFVPTKVAEGLSGRPAGLLERQLISQYRLENLTNQVDGGQGASFLKPDNERRISVSLSVSGLVLAGLRAKLETHLKTPPTLQEVQAFTRTLIYDAIEAYIAEPFVPDDDEE